MDVLHFLKTHHDSIRDAFVALDAADGVKSRRTLITDLERDVQVHLVLERDYLYPEISGLFAGAEALVATGLADGAAIVKRVKALAKLASKTVAEQEAFPKRSAELRDAVSKHFEQEEQILMPKMRAMIRTEDREDLGQVFMDVRAELLASLQPEQAVPAVARPPSRKRA